MAFLSDRQNPEDERGEWLITYADMITLLLSFFVLLVAMSRTDAALFERVIKSFQATVGQSVRLEEKAKEAAFKAEILGSQQRELINRVDSILKSAPDLPFITTQFDRNRLLITIQDQALFPSGEATLLPQAKATLARVAEVLRTFPEYRVDIKGHTDSRPIDTPAFPSNWELSAVRATTVLRFMLDQGISPFRMTATGLADIDPIAPNDSPENRALNRRVEFVLEKER